MNKKKRNLLRGEKVTIRQTVHNEEGKTWVEKKEHL